MLKWCQLFATGNFLNQTSKEMLHITIIVPVRYCRKWRGQPFFSLISNGLTAQNPIWAHDLMSTPVEGLEHTQSMAAFLVPLCGVQVAATTLFSFQGTKSAGDFVSLPCVYSIWLYRGACSVQGCSHVPFCGLFAALTAQSSV
jgi:hypothetical protein